jgi:aspartyl-tRNA(Asn)/glutamyl-tRNA(Gln) amidotransferase subunit C
MSVDPGVVEYVAGLAKLNLDGDERAALAEQLARILEFVEQLDEVDVTDVPPTKHVIGQTNVSRADDPRPCLPQEAALDGAPREDEGHFLVPKVLPD